ncbi:alpha/beta hydrolase [Gordonia polyisoprenivorans]|uniref:lipase family protein n=1 Tax=Gordonia polyisoprenivorans TaxID=84595 RepID=UPI0013FDE4A7|nr:lipase family protein [Gordonia polyisoprenivorans]QUD81739.1 alpha/beta hydrolase [Gordonia polyisoprenivorans]
MTGVIRGHRTGVIRRHRVLFGLLAVAVIVLLVLVVVISVRLASILVVGKESVGFRPGQGPGSVVTAETFNGLPVSTKLAGVKAFRVTYRSTDATTNTPTVVSAVVVAGTGDPPRGGRPVIAFAHGTTGINTPCAPSVAKGMYGLGALAGNLARQGYVVTLPDYQGLGAPGIHPYLDAPTAGFNVIDSVRAARAVLADTSPLFVAYGGSQGGGAVVAAATEFPTYGAGLEMLGAAALAPAADVVGVAAKARAGTATPDQRLMLQWVIESWARADHTVALDDYRTGAAVGGWDALSQCAPSAGARREAVATQLRPTDIGPRTIDAQNRLTARLIRSRAPVTHTPVPLLIAYGGKDTFIDPAWTRAYIGELCAAGTVVDADFQPDKGHGDLDGDAVLGWIGQRFTGATAPDTCAGG